LRSAATMQVHPAFVAQRRETRMHFRRNRAGVRPQDSILGPQALFREPFGEVFDNGE